LKLLNMTIQISELSNTGDARGLSFTLPSEALAFLGRVADLHLASTAPGAVRGNHYHLRRREAIVILPGAAWSLHWDEGEGMPAQHRGFDGTSAVLVLVSPGSSHAVRNDNDGGAPLWLVACSSEPYDPTETVAQKVV
jgi:oxalate decarboxylase/phosphoglucose isomerase-like protein (cupin superfamily)